MHEISEEVLKKAADGDIEAFEVIYRAFSGFVYNVARRVVCNAQESEEVVQEVFLIVHRQLKLFRRQSSVKTWIYRITVNCAINRCKKMSREEAKRKEYGADLTAGVIADGALPATENGDHGKTIEAFLNTLNPDQRACIVLRNMEGLSYRQIADALKVSINTVRSRLKRAREKLVAVRKEVIGYEL